LERLIARIGTTRESPFFILETISALHAACMWVNVHDRVVNSAVDVNVRPFKGNGIILVCSAVGAGCRREETKRLADDRIEERKGLKLCEDIVVQRCTPGRIGGQRTAAKLFTQCLLQLWTTCQAVESPGYCSCGGLVTSNEECGDLCLDGQQLY
jgi:hypothetical protein